MTYTILVHREIGIDASFPIVIIFTENNGRSHAVSRYWSDLDQYPFSYGYFTDVPRTWAH